MRDDLRDVVARVLFRRDPVREGDTWDGFDEVGRRVYRTEAGFVLDAIAAHYSGATHIDLSTWEGVLADPAYTVKFSHGRPDVVLFDLRGPKETP